MHRAVQPSPQSILEHFHHPIKKAYAHQQSFPIFLLPSPRQLWIYFLSIDLPTLVISCKWNHTVCDPLRLTSFTWHNVLKVHPCCNIGRFFILFMAKYYSMLYTGYTTFAYLFISWRTTFSIFWLLQIRLLWTFVYKFLCGHMFSVLLSIYLEIELLSIFEKLPTVF